MGMTRHDGDRLRPVRRGVVTDELVVALAGHIKVDAAEVKNLASRLRLTSR